MSPYPKNGIAEIKPYVIMHIVETVRCLLISSNVPTYFWAEAALTAAYLINRLPSSTVGNVFPVEKLTGLPPSYSRLRVFGCTCYVLLHSSVRDKLAQKSSNFQFLGYG